MCARARARLGEEMCGVASRRWKRQPGFCPGALTAPSPGACAAAGLLCLLLGAAVVSLHYALPSALRTFLDPSVKDCGNHARGSSPLNFSNSLHKPFGASDVTVSTNL